MQGRPLDVSKALGEAWLASGPGLEAAIAAIIGRLAREIDGRIVGFPWNDLADHFAVQGRDQQSKEAVIQLVYRAGTNKKEQFVGFDCFSIHALANIHDCGSWQSVQMSSGHHRCKLANPLVERERYEIIARRTPRFVLPSRIREKR
jgi:hypothetical protein